MLFALEMPGLDDFSESSPVGGYVVLLQLCWVMFGYIYLDALNYNGSMTVCISLQSIKIFMIVLGVFEGLNIGSFL